MLDEAEYQKEIDRYMSAHYTFRFVATLISKDIAPPEFPSRGPKQIDLESNDEGLKYLDKMMLNKGHTHVG